MCGSQSSSVSPERCLEMQSLWPQSSWSDGHLNKILSQLFQGPDAHLCWKLHQEERRRDGERMRGRVARPYQSQYHKEHNHETIKSSKSILCHLSPWFSLWPSRANPRVTLKGRLSQGFCEFQNKSPTASTKTFCPHFCGRMGWGGWQWKPIIWSCKDIIN